MTRAEVWIEYFTAVVLCVFLNQVLRDGKEASCQSAVARIASHCLQRGVQPLTNDMGGHCKAGAKLPGNRDARFRQGSSRGTGTKDRSDMVVEEPSRQADRWLYV
jgi:hypothetical protein